MCLDGGTVADRVDATRMNVHSRMDHDRVPPPFDKTWHMCYNIRYDSDQRRRAELAESIKRIKNV